MIFRLGVNVSEVKNVLIWGNHSSTQFPDVRHATVNNAGQDPVPVYDAINNDKWLQEDFVTVSEILLYNKCLDGYNSLIS